MKKERRKLQQQVISSGRENILNTDVILKSYLCDIYAAQRMKGHRRYDHADKRLINGLEAFNNINLKPLGWYVCSRYQYRYV